MKTEQLIEKHEEAIRILEAVQSLNNCIDSLNDSIMKLSWMASKSTVDEWRREIKEMQLDISRLKERYINLMKS